MQPIEQHLRMPQPAPCRHLPRTAQAVAAILALAVAWPAGASRPPSDCLWAALPQATRAAIVAGYARAGSEALASVPVEDAVLRRAGRICGLDVAGDRLMPLVGASLAGASLKHAAEAALVSQGVPVARLDRAWALTPKVEKTLILKNAASAGPTDRAAAKQFFDAMASLAVRAGAPTPAGRSPMNDRPFRTYVDYFLGRAQREAFQLKIAEARR